jgi:hypothetical protein
VKATVLSLVSDGAPDTTATVVFQNADGSVASDGAVDAAGHAQAMLPGGGSVTSIRITSDTPNGLTAQVTTILGVKPGDDLTFGFKAAGTITNQGGQTSMAVSFTAPDAGASYTAYTACGSVASTPAVPPSPLTLQFRDSCHGATFDLVVVASGGKLASPMFAKLTGVAHANGESFTIPQGFTTMASYAVNMTNIPDAVSSLTVTRSSMIDSTPAADEVFPATDPPAGPLSITLPFPQAFGTRSQVAVTMNRADATSTQRHERHTATLMPSADFDLGTQLPWLGSVAVTATGASWATVVPGDAPDGMLTQWVGRWNDGARPVTILWRVVQPAEASGMTLPRLPAAYAALDPGQQAVTVTPTTVGIVMVDYDKVAGYDELRQMPETLALSSIGSIGAFVDVAFGRRVVVAVARQGVVGGSGPGGFAADPAQ